MDNAATYDHVYFVFLDAAGHSGIVAGNPRDRVAEGFDLLRERVERRLAGVAANHRCSAAVVWQWAGDGGLLLVQDDRESVAAATALGVARSLLELDLRHLRDEFAQLAIRGELHLRISVHKGTLRYRGRGHESAIYGTAVNLAAHLERAAPPDTVVISADVFRIAGGSADGFQPVGTFKGTEVYVLSVNGDDAVRPWLAVHGIAGGVRIHAYPERPSQHEKARLIDAAAHGITELGTALYTCANYLVAKERPARYRQAVLDLLGRGGSYQCVLVDPDAAGADLIGRHRGEDLPGKIRESLARFERFKEDNRKVSDGLEVYLTNAYPGQAAFGVDVRTPQALLLYSPYLTPIGGDVRHLERADMPHYLVGRSGGRLFTVVADQLLHALESARRVL